MSAPTIHQDVVCPFCALGCDDLVVEASAAALRVVAGGAAVCRARFEQPIGGAEPRIAGATASLEQAIERAALILAASRMPLIGGLGTDTAGVRAALRLAERVGGSVDHLQGEPLLANVRAMQSQGWVTATLAEVRNRADLVVFFGTEAVSLMPRFFERVVWPETRLPGMPAERWLVFVGDGLDASVGLAPDGAVPEAIACPPARLAEAAALLRAFVANRSLPARRAGEELPAAALQGLAGRLRQARYGVIVWAAGTLGRQADLAVGSLGALLQELNRTTRAVGLPLAAGDNGIGANQVCGWSWGVPLRSDVASGAPDYDPQGYATRTLLERGRGDALVWISSFQAAPPPAASIPRIALVHSGVAPEPTVEVMIPVGVPGLDHAGSVFRTDSVVALPVRQLRRAGLPSAAEILDRITRRLPTPRAAAC
jgi:formylmethanofuran dehydrogenase subunit B